VGRLITLLGLVRNRDWTQLSLTLRTQVVPKFLFYRYDIAFVRMERLRIPDISLDHIQTRRVSPVDVALLNQVKSRHDEFKGAFAAGDAGYVAFCAGRPAAYLWFECGGLHRSPPNLYDFDLGQRGLWSYGVEVHPDFRMKGALAKIWADAIADMDRRGFGAVYAGIPRDNELSLKSHMRLGFELLYSYRVWRLFGFGWHTIVRSDGTRRSHFGWHHGHAHPDDRSGG
jgi:hypothetical protein